MRYVLGSILVSALILVGGCSGTSQLSGGANADASAPEAKSDGLESSPRITTLSGRPAPPVGGPTNASGVVPSRGQPTETTTLPASLQQPTVTVQRAVIRHAALTVRVKNVEEAEKKANQWVTRSKGYVEGTDSNDLSSDQAQIMMTLRVPVGSFDDALAYFEGLGARINKKISGEDVTGKILEFDARLKTMRTQE